MNDTNANFYQVSVKGLFFDEDGKLMMMREDDGTWELPGGRMQKGEEFIECLKRECVEETGLRCEVLEGKPFCAWPAIDNDGRGRIMVCFKVRLESLDFKPSDECQEIKFFNKEEIKKLNINSQMRGLFDFI